MPSASHDEIFDYVLLGGGLQNVLIALALLANRPNVRLAVVERGESVGGNHIWCFHAGDLSEQMAALVEPMVVRRWVGYDVAFPALERRMTEPYAAVSSAALGNALGNALRDHPSCALLTGKVAVRIGGDEVLLDDGTVLRAQVVVEALGPDRRAPARGDGFQKFLGLELRLARPVNRDVPLVMDARVEQLDGFRFYYVLPLQPDTVLVEETRFSSSPHIDREAFRQGVLAYAEGLGVEVAEICREELGVLPLPVRQSPGRRRSENGSYVAGYQGGWFHPVSAYSFPIAAKVAEVVGSTPSHQLADAWASLVRDHARRARFAFLLNRLFFTAFAEGDRRNVIQGFYRLPAATIRRFYSLSLTPLDCARILCGRAPKGFSLRLALGGGLE